jgi:hypothetical protein
MSYDVNQIRKDFPILQRKVLDIEFGGRGPQAFLPFRGELVIPPRSAAAGTAPSPPA